MKSIQEVFSGEFADAALAVIQKLHPERRNITARQAAYTEHWPRLPPERPADVLVLSVAKENDKKCREIWAGFITEVVPGTLRDFRFHVDRFRHLGDHNLRTTPDSEFYGQGSGGGARTYAANLRRPRRVPDIGRSGDIDANVADGMNERRLVWVRKNHRHFHDPVWLHWDGKCAVTGADCHDMLVTSHIHPWARSTPQEKTDPNNGLLLAVPIDKLFDKGWISFSSTGELLIKSSLSQETRAIFGLRKETMRIERMDKVTPKMLAYLERHRSFHQFE